jgi:heme-degrading monooxygenase HmoA
VEKTRKAKVKGLRARWLAEDVNDKDSGITVTIWDNEANMRAYERSDFFKKEMLPPLQPFFVDSYTTMYCDVKVSEEYK